MKTFKVLFMFLVFVAVLSTCNLPGGSSLPIPTVGHTPRVSVVTLTLQINPIQTKIATFPPSSPSATLTVFPIFTPMTSDAPTWKVYNYTCELATGGATMTMNLTWTDRSKSEEGYKVYRDGQLIATLVPDSTSYVDIAFVAAGKTLSYYVDAFTPNWHLGTNTISYGCQ